MPNPTLIGDYLRPYKPLDRPVLGLTWSDANRLGCMGDYGRMVRRLPQEAVDWLMRRFTWVV